jgi:hypothetical protein
MTVKASYTSEEWTTLARSAAMVGLGMLAVSNSGPVGKLRELGALSRCWKRRALPRELRHYTLVVALLDEARRHTWLPLSPAKHSAFDQSAEAILLARRRMVDAAAQAATLVAARACRQEAEGFARWLLWIAEQVAGASGEGWLGMGRRISDAERYVLGQLADTLRGVTRAPAPTADELEALLGLRAVAHRADGVSGGSGGGDSDERLATGGAWG